MTTEECGMCGNPMDPDIGHETCEEYEVQDFNRSFGLDVDGQPIHKGSRVVTRMDIAKSLEKMKRQSLFASHADASLD